MRKLYQSGLELENCVRAGPVEARAANDALVARALRPADGGSRSGQASTGSERAEEGLAQPKRGKLGLRYGAGR